MRTLVLTVLAISLSPAVALAAPAPAPAAKPAAAAPAAKPAPAPATPDAGTAGAPAAKPAAATPAVPTPKPPPGFEPVSGAAKIQPNLPAPPLVITAYLFIWACILFYVLVLWRKQAKVNAEIETLQQRLEKAAKD